MSKRDKVQSPRIRLAYVCKAHPTSSLAVREARLKDLVLGRARAAYKARYQRRPGREAEITMCRQEMNYGTLVGWACEIKRVA